MKQRMQQQASQRKQDLCIMRKVVSRSIARSHLSSLKDRALAHLLDAGSFADSVQLAVDSQVMPQLLQAVQSQMQQAVIDRQIVNEVLKSTVDQRLASHNKVLEVERRRIETIDQAEREARQEKEEQRKQQEAEAKRIQTEKEQLLEWEAFVPEPPAPTEDAAADGQDAADVR